MPVSYRVQAWVVTAIIVGLIVVALCVAGCAPTTHIKRMAEFSGITGNNCVLTWQQEGQADAWECCQTLCAGDSCQTVTVQQCSVPCSSGFYKVRAVRDDLKSEWSTLYYKGN